MTISQQVIQRITGSCARWLKCEMPADVSARCRSHSFKNCYVYPEHMGYVMQNRGASTLNRGCVNCEPDKVSRNGKCRTTTHILNGFCLFSHGYDEATLRTVQTGRKNLRGLLASKCRHQVDCKRCVAVVHGWLVAWRGSTCMHQLGHRQPPHLHDISAVQHCQPDSSSP